MASGFGDPEAIGTHCPWTREASLAKFRIHLHHRKSPTSRPCRRATTRSQAPAVGAEETSEGGESEPIWGFLAPVMPWKTHPHPPSS